MNVLHVPRILLLNLALVKVLAVHAVSATLTLVHVGVCCVVSLKVLFAQAFTTWRKVTVAIACPMPRRLIVVETSCCPIADWNHHSESEGSSFLGE